MHNISPIHNTLSSLLLLRRCDLFFFFCFSLFWKKKVCAPTTFRRRATPLNCVLSSNFLLDNGRVRLGYCCTPYQRLWLYNGAPLVAFYDTLGIRRTYFDLNPRHPHGGDNGRENFCKKNVFVILNCFKYIRRYFRHKVYTSLHPGLSRAKSNGTRRCSAVLRHCLIKCPVA